MQALSGATLPRVRPDKRANRVCTTKPAHAGRIAAFQLHTMHFSCILTLQARWQPHAVREWIDGHGYARWDLRAPKAHTRCAHQSRCRRSAQHARRLARAHTHSVTPAQPGHVCATQAMAPCQPRAIGSRRHLPADADRRRSAICLPLHMRCSAQPVDSATAEPMEVPAATSGSWSAAPIAREEARAALAATATAACSTCCKTVDRNAKANTRAKGPREGLMVLAGARTQSRQARW